MPDRFKWEETERPQSLNSRVKEAFHSPASLKPRLELAISRTEAQSQRLDQTAQRLSERDKSLFAKIIDAYSRHDAQRANVFASELAEIRKTQKTVMHARLALEQIVLRLKTVTELGDMVGALAPIVGVLRTIRSSIVGVLPDAGRELEQIGTMLSGIIMDAGHTTGLTLNFDTANEDAKNILTEAASVAEQKMKDKFPELPNAVPSSGNQAQGKT